MTEQMEITPREIKFRAFADFGKFKLMLDDVTLHTATNMVGLHYEALVELLEPTDWKINDDYEFENNKTGETVEHDSVKVYDTGEEYFFIEDTKVMQYTGLKDKNGKEKFEGDITFYELQNRTFVIQFMNGAFWEVCVSDNSFGKSLIAEGKGEIIGNIFSDPSLLNNTTDGEQR